MLRLLSTFVAVVLSSSVVAPAQDEKLDSRMADEGGRLFRTYCGSCHGKTALGDGPLAKDLKVPPANLTQLSEKNGGRFPFEMVVETIDHGRNVRGHGTEEMPAWGDAFKMTSQSDDQPRTMMRALAHYLWSLQPK